ncbi:MAG: ribonucleoside-diphosphate reductase subunit alpha [Bacteroidota bacterium]|nr:ribonucleoside-diphosphate reductase subunit alpha [Candidatus Kapabacteria bacterium]MCS7303112.1 ribonucleoside-diphosphate reductase subunit alpha [Candidatus Kapabacteria bacterium]MCX7937687.1 ribonucleoside-diphosphate reductase subunit alpha [Chlorobiota bacterium]MDW8075963.1 ribonucleoside-diphosphate reductase subunit alpha [Bacteroidota bacterium]
MAPEERPPFYWLNEESRRFLSREYLLPGVTPEQRLRQIAEYAESILQIQGFADKFYEYMGRGWYSLSTPVWTNFGLRRGLPISCYGSYISDDSSSILFTVSEVGMMTKLGGGTSAYFGELRPRGAPISQNGYSNGSFSFAKLFDRIIDVFSQGNTRRGQCAAYIDIEHPDIEEWLNIQREGCEIQTLYWGVCVGNDWLDQMKNGDIAKQRLWAKVLESRAEVGIPYIVFRDNANNSTVDVYKQHGMRIYASNLCTEIFLPSNAEESFVCCLSSLNLLHYDEWKDTDAVETLVFFLDAVLEDFVRRSKGVPFMQRAHNFVVRHRALGMGVLGWHSLLQAKRIPIESMDAFQLNAEIFRTIYNRAYDASAELARRFGEPEYLQGYGRRNATLIAVAPTKSSSFILGQVSPSIEPLMSNYHVKDLAKAKTTYKNPFLQQVLRERSKDTDEVWQSIAAHNGSVQHLDFLSEEERKVFKTFSEISQMTLVQQAAQRQKYIDQGQSLNLMIHPAAPVHEVNQLLLRAAELGLKSLYYQYSVNAAQEFNRELLLGCAVCEA